MIDSPTSSSSSSRGSFHTPVRSKGGMPKSVSLQSGIHEIERSLAAQATIDAKNKASNSKSSQPTNSAASTSSVSANPDSSSHVASDVISPGVKTSHSDSELNSGKNSTSNSQSETSKGAPIKNSNEFQGKNCENSPRENKPEGQESKTVTELDDYNSATNLYAKNGGEGKVLAGPSSVNQFTEMKRSDGISTSICDSQEIAQMGKTDRPQSLPLRGSEGGSSTTDEDLKVPVEERGAPSGSSTPNNLVDEFTETLNKIEGLMKDTDALSRDLAAHGEWYSGSASQAHAKIGQSQVKSRSVSQESIEA